MRILCVPGAPRGQERVSDPWNQSYRTESLHVDAGNQTQASARAALARLSSPHYALLFFFSFFLRQGLIA